MATYAGVGGQQGHMISPGIDGQAQRREVEGTTGTMRGQ